MACVNFNSCFSHCYFAIYTFSYYSDCNHNSYIYYKNNKLYIQFISEAFHVWVTHGRASRPLCKGIYIDIGLLILLCIASQLIFYVRMFIFAKLCVISMHVLNIYRTNHASHPWLSLRPGKYHQSGTSSVLSFCLVYLQQSPAVVDYGFCWSVLYQQSTMPKRYSILRLFIIAI